MGKLLYLKRVVLIFLVVYVGLGTFLFVSQNDLIYHPDRTDFSNCPAFSNSEKIKLGSTRMYFTKRSPDKVVIFYHGNAGRACDRDYIESFLAKENYSSIFVEYSGYGETENKPSMIGILKNVTDTIEFLKTLDFTEIIVSGESLGAGPAAYHASISKVSNVVLITAYNNFTDVAFSHYPVFPMKLLLHENFTPDKWLVNYTGPISIILAENDEIIPNKLGKKLYENLTSDLKKIFIVKNVGHNTIYGGNEFYLSLKEALK